MLYTDGKSIVTISRKFTLEDGTKHIVIHYLSFYKQSEWLRCGQDCIQEEVFLTNFHLCSKEEEEKLKKE